MTASDLETRIADAIAMRPADDIGSTLHADFAQAVFDGDVGAMRVYLAAFPDKADAPTTEKMSPFFLAVNHGQLEAAGFLLEYGPDITRTYTGTFQRQGDLQGLNIVHAAVFSRNPQVVDFVLSLPVTPEQLNAGVFNGYAPLHWTMMCELPEHNKSAMIKSLIAAGADPDSSATGWSMFSPVGIALAMNDDAALQTLLDHRASFKDGRLEEYLEMAETGSAQKIIRDEVAKRAKLAADTMAQGAAAPVPAVKRSAVKPRQTKGPAT